MYELVNTSVPNGLIAGTHGFATVAMTKGMPDAIRTRVEGLCAYPHRTSAHDESYYRENPVNWFHLTLPSGDHVVGRTVPSDFDYTGRTNRLARTIVFRRGEMPVSGGCEAIRIAGSHLSEKWSGEPRMLPADKALAAKFFALERSRDATPANWVALFGDKGMSLAKRVAMLVARNAMGGGKSVYFKTSTSWDADGTKLLALFSDIINLLPDEAAPLVTFSTFATCVPSGVTCHLRGVYDKDKAFELASATQPWVDCEHGRVMHEELLPSESAPIGVSGQDSRNEQTTIAVETSGNSRLGIHRDSSAVASQSARNRASAWPRPQSDDDRSLYMMLGGLAAVIVLVVGVCCYYMFFYSATPLAGKDELLTLAENEKRAEDEKARQEAAAKQAAEEEKARQAKEDEARRRAEEAALERKKKEEADRRAAVEEVERAKQREKEENEERAKNTEKDARDKLVNVAFNDIVVTDVIFCDVEYDYERLFRERLKILKLPEASLTNEGSIVAWYTTGGHPKRMACNFEARSRKDPRTGKRTVEYKLRGGDIPAEASWVLWQVARSNASAQSVMKPIAIWQWRMKFGPFKLFEKSDEADLAAVCFGESKICDVYSKDRRVFYRVSWKEKDAWFALESYSSNCPIKVFEHSKEELDKVLSDLNEKIDGLKRQVEENKLSKAEMEMLKGDIERYEEELIRLRNKKDKTTDSDGKNMKILERRRKSINDEVVPKLGNLKIQEQSLLGDEVEKKRILEAIDRKIKLLEAMLHELRAEIVATEDEIRCAKAENEDWEAAAKGREYFVEVIPEMRFSDGNIYKLKGEK